MACERSLRFVWVAAAAAMVLGLGLTIGSLAGMSRDRERYDKRVVDLKTLEALARNTAAREAAARAWAAFDTPARPLSDLLRTTTQDGAPAIRDLEPAAGPPGWQVRRTAVVLTDAPYARLTDAVQSAAAARPPWTLAECVLQASARPGTASRMELVFETVERTGK